MKQKKRECELKYKRMDDIGINNEYLNEALLEIK